MSTPEELIIPPDTRTAAKRGFVRTTAQAFAASIPTAGVSAGTLVAVVQDPDPVPGSYINPIAQNWQTKSWPTITAGHAAAIKRDLDKVRQGK